MSHQEEIDQALAGRTRLAEALRTVPGKAIAFQDYLLEEANSNLARIGALLRDLKSQEQRTAVFDDFDFCCVSFILYVLNGSGEKKWPFHPLAEIAEMPAWEAGQFRVCPTCQRGIQRIVREGSSSIWRRVP